MTSSAQNPHPILILGSGMAGITLAREIRKLDKDVPLTIITADDGAYYSKPMLSNALASNKQPAQLAMQNAATLAQQLNATILSETVVDAVLPNENKIQTSRGELHFQSLVLALGADPIRLPIEGDAAEAVLSVNSLTDYASFRAQLEGKQRIALLGAGLIGCEFANDLRSAGRDVVVYDIAPHPLGRLLPPQAGAWMHSKLSDAGIRFHLGRSVARVEQHGSAVRVVADDGSVEDVDLVLSAVGLRPKTELAKAAGLNVNRGIEVDAQLRTNQAQVFALGDCAEVKGLVLPYVMPIMNAARALAATLTGSATAVRYPAMPVVVKTPACPTVVCPPLPNVQGAWEETLVTNDAGVTTGVRALYKQVGGAVQGFALLGEATAEKQKLAAELADWL